LKILVIGDEDLSLPFRAAGCEAKIARDGKEGRKILLESIEEGYGIIFIAESIATGCMDVISQVSETKNLPLISIIPDVIRGEVGAAEERMRQLVKRAVGIELPEG